MGSLGAPQGSSQHLVRTPEVKRVIKWLAGLAASGGNAALVSDNAALIATFSSYSCFDC